MLPTRLTYGLITGAVSLAALLQPWLALAQETGDQGPGRGLPSISVLDILIIGFAIFLAFRLFSSRSKRKGGQGPRQMGDQSGNSRDGQDNGSTKAQPREGIDRYKAAEAAWDQLRAKPKQPGSGAGSSPTPTGFDEDEFLSGAKAFYSRLQEAWDDRDLEDIRGFTTDSLFKEIQKRADNDPEPGHTDILLVNARLVNLEEGQDKTLATVHYDVLMREGRGKEAPSQVQEIWRFIKDPRDSSSTWKLESIHDSAQGPPQ